MLNFGSFQKSYTENEKRLDGKRKENVALYSNFIRDNPNASVEDRDQYAESLAGGNKGFRSVLPSRSAMEANVAEVKRKKAVAGAKLARAEADRERNIKLQNLKLANDAATWLGDSLQTSDMKTATKGVVDLYGEFLPEGSLDAIKARGDRLGWAKYQQTVSPLLQAYRQNPTEAGLNALKMAGYNGDYGDRMITAEGSYLDTAKKKAVANVTSAAMDLAASTDINDDNTYNAKQAKIFADAGTLLTEEERQTITSSAMNRRETLKKEIARVAETKLMGVAQQLTTQIGSVNMNSEAELKTMLQAAIDADPDLANVNSAKALELLNSAFEEVQDKAFDDANDAETAKTVEDIATLKANRANQISPTDLSNIVENELMSRTEIPTEDGKIKSEGYSTLIKQKSAAVQNAIRIIGSQGINISDAGVVAQLVKTVYELQDRKQGAAALDTTTIEIDHEILIEAYDEMLNNNSSAINPTERAATQMALANLGYGSLKEAYKGSNITTVTAAIEEQLTGIIERNTDILGEERSELSSIITASENKVGTLLKNVEGQNVTGAASVKPNEIGLADRADQLITAATDLEGVENLTDWAKGNRVTLQRISNDRNLMVSEVTRLKALMRHPIYRNDETAIEVGKVQLKALQDKIDTVTGLAATLGQKINDAAKVINSYREVTLEPNKKEAVQNSFAAQLKGKSEEEIFKNVWAYVQQLEQQAPGTMGNIVRENSSLDTRGQPTTESGEIPFGPYIKEEAPASGVGRLLGEGNIKNTVPDYMKYMKEIYSILGMEMPTATEARQMIEGKNLNERFLDGMDNLGEGVGDYFNYLFKGDDDVIRYP